MMEEPLTYEERTRRLTKEAARRMSEHEPGAPLHRLIGHWTRLMEFDLAWAVDLPRMREEVTTTPREATREYLAGRVADLEAKNAALQKELAAVRTELTAALPHHRW